MKTKRVLILASAITLVIALVSCHKADNTPGPTPTPTTPPTTSAIIANYCANVAIPDYSALLSNAQSFQAAATTFSANPNDNDLNTMRNAWKGMRVAYESAEAFLLGPIATLNLDPNVDTWPVEKNNLDSLLNSSTAFTPSLMASLPQTLTGFHPIEYLIFGQGGTATAADFTVTTNPTGARKIEYLMALTTNLVSNITLIRSAYTVGSSDDFISIIENPGPTNSTYQTHKAALLDLVNSMSDICDEVGGSASDGKIYSVYSTQNAALQESYFSNNSWADFSNNIIGVRNAYLGVYGGSTTPAANSLYNLVAAKNISLNNAIMASINNAVGSFSAATSMPFGQAVQLSGGERTQVLNVMNAIDSLQSILNNKLVPFINQYVTD
ncbi:MAG TPA: imelysin family protein [Bacteroidia bacterium]|nr:imelysin family protein [Bacteroidia bacterium]